MAAVGGIKVRESPDGVVLGPGRGTTAGGMALAATMILAGTAVLAYLWMNAASLDRGTRDWLLVVGLVPLGTGALLAITVPLMWKHAATAPPVLIERLYEGTVELPRLGLRIDARRIARVQSLSGWVVRSDVTEDKWQYFSQLVLVEHGEDGDELRRLLASSPLDLYGEIRRPAARLARLLGVPHEHIQVRVRGGVAWEDLFESSVEPTHRDPKMRR